MKLFNGFFAGLRNARFLMFPPAAASTPMQNGSVMTGVYPDSELWSMIYGPVDEQGSALRWRKFKRRHEVALERATLYRSLVLREAPQLVSAEGSVPVSLRRPEIIVAGVVGGSMRGAGISYMDIVAIYPKVGELTFEINGDGEVDSEGNTIWTDFSIDLGDGVVLRNGDIGMFKYKNDMVSDAKKRCPDDLVGWVDDVTKIRKVESIKRTPDGKTLVCVSTYRETKEMGDDHDLTGLLGRAFSHYEAGTYEARLKNSGLWNSMSVAARYPHFIGPKSDWDADFANLSPEDRSLVQSALLGESDPFEVRVQELLEQMTEQALDVAS